MQIGVLAREMKFLHYNVFSGRGRGGKEVTGWMSE
jgi:hypothetical protein